MTSLAAVDSLDIQIIVDNVTDSLSSVPSFIETELGGLGRRRGGAWVLGGNCLCCAAHGLSCLLTVKSGGRSHSVLFDTGPEDRVFEQNVSRLGLDLGPVEAMADASPPATGASTSGGLRRRHLAGIFRIEDERERPVELANRDAVRHQPGLLRPDMQMETRRLHGEA